MTVQEQLKEELNDEQYEAAMHLDGPAVIMAGAGSGKTHTLIGRVVNLVDRGIRPQRILMLTFTNAAADEMKSRAANKLDDRCGEIVGCTYHKFCNTMLRQYGYSIGVKNYMILSPIEDRNLIEYVKSSDPEYNNLKGFPSAKILQGIFSKKVNCQKDIKDILYEDDSLAKFLHYFREIEVLYNKVNEYCFEKQKYNYDHLLIYMNELLNNDDICRKVAQKFDYIMVDEFQDTNNLQEEILIKLSKFNRNIMVVGDISQSIYAFRGANVRNLQNFHKKFDDCKVIVLNTNYRSNQEILDFANLVMKCNVKSWTYFDMKADNKHGEAPKLVRPYDDFDQLEQVLTLIEDYYMHGVPYNDMAVLERGSMSSFGLEAELTKNNIPYEKRGGLKFMDYECIGDMLAYLSIISNPYDELSWFRILKIHPFIGSTYSKRIADNCKNSGFLVDPANQKKKYYHELEKLDTQYIVFRNISDFHKLFDKIVEFYFETRERALEFSRMKADAKVDAAQYIERDRTILEQLKNISMKYDTITAFLDDLLLDSVSEEEKSEDSLIISTIHSAKGLEWKIVFLIDCVEGTFPSRVKEYGSEEDEEELRCFYVAITRAKDNLYIFSPKFKMKNGFLDRVERTHYIV